MVWMLFYACVIVLACIGFVHVVAWIAVRTSCKGNHVYKVMPVGGQGKDTDRQLALFYACVQWESNPSKQAYILYGPGLDEKATRDCEELAQGMGIYFADSPAKLESLLK